MEYSQPAHILNSCYQSRFYYQQCHVKRTAFVKKLSSCQFFHCGQNNSYSSVSFRKKYMYQYLLSYVVLELDTCGTTYINKKPSSFSTMWSSRKPLFDVQSSMETFYVFEGFSLFFPFFLDIVLKTGSDSSSGKYSAKGASYGSSELTIINRYPASQQVWQSSQDRHASDSLTLIFTLTDWVQILLSSNG